MLYQLYETQRALMEPFAEYAHATSKMLSNPLWPISQTNTAQRASAGFDLFFRLRRGY